MSIEKLMKQLEGIEVPEHFKTQESVNLDELIEDAQDKVKGKYNEIWSLFLNDDEVLNFKKFCLSYEKDKLAILNNYLEVFRKAKK